MRRSLSLTVFAMSVLSMSGCWLPPGGDPPETVVPETEPNGLPSATWDELPLAPVGFSGMVFSGPGDPYDDDAWARTFPEAGTLTVTCFEGEADLDVAIDGDVEPLARFRCGASPESVEVPVAAGDVLLVIAYSDVLDGISKSYLVTAEFEAAP